MPRLFILFFKLSILLFFVSSCSGNLTVKTDEQIEHEVALTHHIKKITEYIINVKFGNEQKEQLSYVKFFDQNGFKIKEISYSEGVIESIITFEYDKTGNLLNSIAINADSNFLFKVTQNYDENNLRQELYFFLPDGTYKYRNVASYDKSGKMIELRYYWPDGLKAINKYIYQGNNRIEDTEYAPDGKFRYTWNYKYDGKDNLIEAIQFYPNRVINGKKTYEFDKNKLLVTQRNFFGESIQNVFSFTYDDKKLVSAKIVTSASGMIDAKFRYLYEYQH